MIHGMVLALLLFTPIYWIYFAILSVARKNNRFFTYGLVTWLASTLALAVFADLLPGPKLILLVTFTGLWALALNVMAAIANSVTLFMLSELRANFPDGFSIEAVKTSYQQRDAIRGRMLAIARAGLIEETGGTYQITPKGKWVAIPFALIKAIFGIRKVG